MNKLYAKLIEVQCKLKAPTPEYKMGVYAILNPNSQVYIGSSTDIERRFYQYKGLYEHSQPKLYNSLKKYGVNNHQFFILEYCDFDKLYEREREWGNYFEALDRYKGLNLVLPGYGDKKKIVSIETRKKIGRGNRGKFITLEQRESLSKQLRGRKQTKEHIEKRKMVGKANPAYGKAYFKGHKHTEEVRKLFSQQRKGKNKYGENPNAKKVIDNTTGIVYESAKEVAEKFQINYSTLKAWLQGVNKGNGRFEYVR